MTLNVHYVIVPASYRVYKRSSTTTQLISLYVSHFAIQLLQNTFSDILFLKRPRFVIH